MAGRDRPFLDMVFRRELPAMGSAMALSPASVRAAVTAATLVPELVMLLRRVTRWVPLRDPAATECELARECDCRPTDKPPSMELEDMDGRWVSGREACCISLDEAIAKAMQKLACCTTPANRSVRRHGDCESSRQRRLLIKSL